MITPRFSPLFAYVAACSLVLVCAAAAAVLQTRSATPAPVHVESVAVAAIAETPGTPVLPVVIGIDTTRFDSTIESPLVKEAKSLMEDAISALGSLLSTLPVDAVRFERAPSPAATIQRGPVDDAEPIE